MWLDDSTKFSTTRNDVGPLKPLAVAVWPAQSIL
jgi:hypothetical protein